MSCGGDSGIIVMYPRMPCNSGDVSDNKVNWNMVILLSGSNTVLIIFQMTDTRMTFRESYLQNGPDDLEAQLPYLEEIYDSYMEQARTSHSWVHFLKVRFRRPLWLGC